MHRTKIWRLGWAKGSFGVAARVENLALIRWADFTGSVLTSTQAEGEQFRQGPAGLESPARSLRTGLAVSRAQSPFRCVAPEERRRECGRKPHQAVIEVIYQRDCPNRSRSYSRLSIESVLMYRLAETGRLLAIWLTPAEADRICFSNTIGLKIPDCRVSADRAEEAN